MNRPLLNRFVFPVILALLTSYSAAAFEFNSARSTGLGNGLLLSRATAATLLNAPVMGITEGELLIEMSGERRFEFSNLNNATFAAAYRYKILTAALGVMQFGYRDFYAERTLKGSLSLRHRAMIVSVNASGMIVDFGGAYSRLRGSSVGFGISANYRNGYFAFTADDLNSPALHESAKEIKPNYVLYAEYLTSKSFSTIGRLSIKDDRENSFMVGQFFAISTKANLFWSFSTEPTKYGAGLEVAHKQFTLSYATSIHPVLGFTHRIGLLFSYGGARKSGETKGDVFE